MVSGLRQHGARYQPRRFVVLYKKDAEGRGCDFSLRPARASCTHCVWRLVQSNLQPEGTAHARLGNQGQICGHQLRELTADGQTQTCAAEAACDRRIGLRESVEYVLLTLG